MYSPSRWVSGQQWRCGLLPNYFGFLLLLGRIAAIASDSGLLLAGLFLRISLEPHRVHLDPMASAERERAYNEGLGVDPQRAFRGQS